MAQYRVVAEWSQPNGSVAQNILYANIINGEVADQDDLLSDIADEVFRILVAWLARVATTMVLDLVRVYVFDQGTGLSTPVGVFGINEAGTAIGDPLPGGVAAKINWYLPQRSRPFGIYLPTVTEEGVTGGGAMTAAAQASAGTVGLEALVQSTMSLTGLVWRPRVWSPKDLATYDLTTGVVEVDSTYDYQRRRKAGYGV